MSKKTVNARKIFPSSKILTNFVYCSYMDTANPEILAAIESLKKLPFSKSWVTNFITNQKKIFNRETKQIEEKEFEDFIYIPAASLVRYLADNPKFRAFRNEHKFDNDYDFKLVADKFENGNRSLAVKFVAPLFEALEIKFMIDDGYTIFVPLSDLSAFANSGDETLRKLYTYFAIRKTLGRKHGAQEIWGA